MVRPDARMKAEAIKVHRLRESDVAAGRAMEDVLPEFLRFIGARPLVGYYLEFDLAMINKHARRLIGIELPNRRIEVSGLYYERKYGGAPPGVEIDLRFAAILADLGLPRPRPARRLLRRADDGHDVCRASLISRPATPSSRASRARPFTHFGGG